MPKLSASTPADQPGEVTRVDVTPEMIKSMSSEEITTLLKQLRGNREVAGGKSKSSGSGSSAPKAKRDPSADVEDAFEDD